MRWGARYGLRKPLHRHIQSLRELRDGLTGPRTAPILKIRQIALPDTCFELQMQLRLATPVANGLQPTVASKNCRTDLRREHDAAGGQFGLPSIIDSDVIGILGIVMGALQ